MGGVRTRAHGRRLTLLAAARVEATVAAATHVAPPVARLASHVAARGRAAVSDRPSAPVRTHCVLSNSHVHSIRAHVGRANKVEAACACDFALLESFEDFKNWDLLAWLDSLMITRCVPDYGRRMSSRQLIAHLRVSEQVRTASTKHTCSDMTPWSAWLGMNQVSKILRKVPNEIKHTRDARFGAAAEALRPPRKVVGVAAAALPVARAALSAGGCIAAGGSSLPHVTEPGILSTGG